MWSIMLANPYALRSSLGQIAHNFISGLHFHYTTGANFCLRKVAGTIDIGYVPRYTNLEH
jgi:hypothetical protein